MEQIKQNKMGTAPILPLIISMSVPAMFSMMVQALYNIVDSIFVAKIGADALSAISFAFPIQMIMVALGVGTGVGINSLIARRLGEGKKKEASSAATHGLLLSILNWIAMVVVGLFLTKAFFELSTDKASIIAYGTQYVQIITIFSFGVFIQVCVEKTLQATGNMIYPMVSQLLGCAINIVLDPILIFGLFGAPVLGMAGAAIATVIGQICAMLFCIVILVTQSHDVHITFKNFKYDGKIIKNIYAVGFPAIIMQSMASVLVFFLNLILVGFSEAAVNVLGIYYKLQSFVFMPVFGLNQGVMPIMAYNYGAGNKKRLLDTLKYGVIGALLIMFAGMIVFNVMPQTLLALFEADAQTVEIGVPALRTISWCFTGAAVGILFSTLFQAIGMGGKSLFISLIRQLILILPAAYFLSKVSLQAVWFAFPLAELVACVLSIIIFWYLYKEHLQYLKPVLQGQDEE